MLKNYRHGEIALIGIEELPKGLKKSESKVIMAGATGNSHSIDNGTLYFRNEENQVFGYLVAKNTNLLHPEHKDETGVAKIEDGIYKLIKQVEYTPDGLIPVID